MYLDDEVSHALPNGPLTKIAVTLAPRRQHRCAGLCTFPASKNLRMDTEDSCLRTSG